MPFKYNPLTKKLDLTNFTAAEVRLLRTASFTSTGPITKHVATTGSDTTGDGTVALPYATPLRAYADIPHRVAHACNIQIAAGTYPAGSFPRAIDPVLVGDGSLSIFGVGAPTRKTLRGGPHTVTAISSTDITQKVTVAGASGWVADEFKGSWVRVITGGHVKRAWQVQANTTAAIYIPLDGTGDAVHSGDTVEIIAPSTKIEIEDLDIFYDARTIYGDVGWPCSRLVLANLWLDASASPSVDGQLRIHSSASPAAGPADGPVLEFVRVDVQTLGVIVSDVMPNYAYPFNDTYVTGCAADILNMGESNEGPGMCITSAGGSADTLIKQSGLGGLNNVAITGQVRLERFSNTWFDGSAAAIVDLGAASGEIYATLTGVDSSTPAINISGGSWQCVLIDALGACNYAIDIDTGAIVRVHGQCTCSATLCAKSALRIGAMCKVTSDHSLAGFLGATALQNAYICAMAAGVKAATWPAAGTYVTDAKGAEFLRVT